MTHKTTPGVSQTQGTTTQAYRQAAIESEREKIRYKIAKRWRAAGKRIWTAAEMEAEVDRFLEWRRQRQITEATRKATTKAPKPDANQKALFGADEASTATRAQASRSAINRGSRNEAIVKAVKAAGDYGRTSDEISVELEISMHALSPRIKTLVDHGWLIRTKRTRLTRTKTPASVLIAALEQNGGDRA